MGKNCKEKTGKDKKRKHCDATLSKDQLVRLTTFFHWCMFSASRESQTVMHVQWEESADILQVLLQGMQSYICTKIINKK